MIAMERGRRTKGIVVALAASGVMGTWLDSALAQSPSKARRAATTSPAPSQPARVDPAAVPKLEMKALPVNPTDAIATINGEVITRQQLADECVARKGEEILETLIARRLIEQAMKSKNLEVTPAEVDQEIDRVAMRTAGVGREAWLRTLAKERGISPIQYARDIIYPALALRKLAAPRVQVTDKDLAESFESQYGAKIRCRIIMVDKLRTAQEIWEELKKNPAGFEKLAQERSIDIGSRSLGGLLAEPISRHAYPRNVSSAAFAQLVDGDPNDKDPNHKPKDGDFTGPIQVTESSWVIMMREGLIEPQPANPKDERVRNQLHEMIYEVKLKEAMGLVYVEMTKASAIDNKLTGTVKLANEEANPDHRVDGEVKLMGNQEAGAPEPPAPRPASTQGTAGGRSNPAPVGVPAEVLKQKEKLQNSSKPK
jgi:foldase protein PrsA